MAGTIPIAAVRRASAAFAFVGSKPSSRPSRLVGSCLAARSPSHPRSSDRPSRKFSALTSRSSRSSLPAFASPGLEAPLAPKSFKLPLPSSSLRLFSSSSTAAEEHGNDDDHRESGGTSPPNHFAILGLQPPYRYSLSPSALKSTYRSLMAEYHPDKHSSLDLPDEDKDRMAEKAAEITRAYDVLKDDVLRAEHLLEIGTGRGLDERDTGALVGPDLLMTVMEAREAVEDAAASGDADAQLNRLLDENATRFESTASELTRAFDAQDWDEARRLTATLRYWRRIEESVLERIGTVKE